MNGHNRLPHILTGFPAAASAFVAALENNRQKIAREAGLTGSELRALFYVARVVSTTPKELALHLEMTTGAVTAISRRLVDIDLLHRVDHPEDRRSLYLELTNHGHNIMVQLHGDFKKMLAASTSSLNADELELFTVGLSSVATEVKQHSGQPAAIAM